MSPGPSLNKKHDAPRDGNNNENRDGSKDTDKKTRPNCASHRHLNFPHRARTIALQKNYIGNNLSKNTIPTRYPVPPNGELVEVKADFLISPIPLHPSKRTEGISL